MKGIVTMGNGNVAVGITKRPCGSFALTYLPLKEPREFNEYCTDVYPEGKLMYDEDFLAAIVFKNLDVIDQTIHVMQEIRSMHVAATENKSSEYEKTMPVKAVIRLLEKLEQEFEQESKDLMKRNLRKQHFQGAGLGFSKAKDKVRELIDKHVNKHVGELNGSSN